MENLCNMKFERLHVVEFSHRQFTHSYWSCICDCGNTTIVRGTLLKNGNTRSCGCLQRELKSINHTTHGHYRNGKMSRTYTSWSGMLSRCHNVKDPSYNRYGGRGIKVCERWNKFENFLEDMGERPEDMSLDRIDNNGDYCPENCKWSTRKEQMNNKRSNKQITYKGVTKNITQWAEFIGINRNTLGRRLNLYRWSEERALSTPIGER